MKRLFLTSVLSLTVVHSPLHAESVTRRPRVESVPISVVLTLSPDRVLPGEPPQVTLQVTNTSEEPFEVPPAALEVVPPSGDPFVPRGLGGDWLLWPEEYHQNVIPPGETLTLVFGRRLDMPWFCDDRMDDPGAYTVRAYLGPNLFDYRRALLAENTVDGPFATSNAVTYTVVEPTGEDAGAWALIVSQLGHVACGWGGVAERVWEQFPNSHYAAWVPPPPDLPASDLDVERLERAIALDPDGFAADWIRLILAERHRQRAGNALGRSLNRSLPRMIGEMEDYVSTLEQLTSSTNPAVRYKAAEQLRTGPTVESMTNLYHQITAIREGGADSRLKVIPIVECVTSGLKGSFTAMFGYDNPNAYTVTLPIGKTNFLTSAPIQGAQPVEFQPGRKEFVFTVSHRGPSVIWSLDGLTATAATSPAHPARCPPLQR